MHRPGKPEPSRAGRGRIERCSRPPLLRAAQVRARSAQQAPACLVHQVEAPGTGPALGQLVGMLAQVQGNAARVGALVGRRPLLRQARLQPRHRLGQTVNCGGLAAGHRPRRRRRRPPHGPARPHNRQRKATWRGLSTGWVRSRVDQLWRRSVSCAGRSRPAGTGTTHRAAGRMNTEPRLERHRITLRFAHKMGHAAHRQRAAGALQRSSGRGRSRTPSVDNRHAEVSGQPVLGGLRRVEVLRPVRPFPPVRVSEPPSATGYSRPGCRDRLRPLGAVCNRLRTASLAVGLSAHRQQCRGTGGGGGRSSEFLVTNG